MDKQARPRICEVLGVEVGERFRIDYPKGMTVWLHINKEGFVVREGGPKNLKIGNSVEWAINHPDRIIRKPRWTQHSRVCGVFCWMEQKSSHQNKPALVPFAAYK